MQIQVLSVRISFIYAHVHVHLISRHDSVVSDRINYDLLQRIRRLQDDDRSACAELLGGGARTKTRDSVPAGLQRLLCTSAQCRRDSPDRR